MNASPARAPVPAALGAALGLFAAVGCANLNAPVATAPQADPQAACQALAAQSGLLPGATLAGRYWPPGQRRPGNAASGDFLGGHCVVTGSIGARTGVDGKAYATGFQLSLPDGWNGRLLYLGGGGNDGILRDTSLSSSISIGTPSPLGQGYAVVSTDAGHQGPSGVFGLDPVARIDHAFASHEKTALAARRLIEWRYGRLPDRSYFSGCSGGGRQGMMFAQRFPGLFDGITAGAPAMRVSSGATVAAMWNHQQFTAAAPRDASGQPILARAFSDADLQLVAHGINAACDMADGLADGMVHHMQACRFDAATLQCRGEKTAQCLSPAQVRALGAYLGGPTDSRGRALYAGQPPDPGLAAPGWRAWALGSSATAKPDSRYVALMVDALAHEFFTPPQPGFDPLTFNFDTDPARMQWFSAIYDTYADDRLDAFRARGGKLMLIHGMADAIFSANDTLDYYRRLAANHGGMAGVQGFARTFLVPGMNHCSGGPATDTYDSLQSLVDWVEKGIAPDVILARAAATRRDMPGRTRPLCAYPAYARYKGQGDPENAAHFVCTEP